jgi:putative intracellular protease/amidase
MIGGTCYAVLRGARQGRGGTVALTHVRTALCSKGRSAHYRRTMAMTGAAAARAAKSLQMHRATFCTVACCMWMRCGAFVPVQNAARHASRTHGLRSERHFVSMAGIRTVLVPIADGSEEIESVTIIDVLVRAGARVTVASASENLQVSAVLRAYHATRPVPGYVLPRSEDRSGQVRPRVRRRRLRRCGGPRRHSWRNQSRREQRAPKHPSGPGESSAHHKHSDAIARQDQASRLIGAICAAPAVVLKPFGLLEGRIATCYPAPRFVGLVPPYYALRMMRSSR